MRNLALFFSAIIFSFTALSTSFAEISSARNFYQFSDRILTTGQPKQELLENASEDGIEVVINLVPQTEAIYNPKEGEILQSQGIEYIHNPVSWGSPKASQLQSFLEVMKNVGDKKVLIHCWSNARASAFAYAHQVSNDPQTRSSQFENLKKVWKDIAGYNLEANQTWLKFLDENVGAVQ